LLKNHSYKIVVVPRGKPLRDTGLNSAIAGALGKIFPPSDVTDFTATWKMALRMVEFTWTEVDDTDVQNYQIRDGSGTWAAASTVIEKVVGDKARLYIGDSVAEKKTYQIKAIDSSLVESDSADTDTCLIYNEVGWLAESSQLLGDATLMDSDAAEYTTALDTYQSLTNFGTENLYDVGSNYTAVTFAASLYADTGHTCYCRLLEDSVEKIVHSYAGSDDWTDKEAFYETSKTSAAFTTEFKADPTDSYDCVAVANQYIYSQYGYRKILFPSD